MNDATAAMRLYERSSAGEPGARWLSRAGADRQNRHGLVAFFPPLCARGEPIKVEGDKRAPAGIYPIGRSFGILPSSRPGYLQSRTDTVCVNDPSSPAYNTIASRRRVGPA